MYDLSDLQKTDNDYSVANKSHRLFFNFCNQRVRNRCSNLSIAEEEHRAYVIRTPIKNPSQCERLTNQYPSMETVEITFIDIPPQFVSGNFTGNSDSLVVPGVELTYKKSDTECPE